MKSKAAPKVVDAIRRVPIREGICLYPFLDRILLLRTT